MCAQKTIDIDLEDFNDDEILAEANKRSLIDDASLGEFDDNEILVEARDRLLVDDAIARDVGEELSQIYDELKGGRPASALARLERIVSPMRGT